MSVSIKRIRLIQSQSGRLRTALAADDWEEFDRRLAEVIDRAKQRPSEDIRIGEDLIALVGDYPAVAALLNRENPSLFPDPNKPTAPPNPVTPRVDETGTTRADIADKARSPAASSHPEHGPPEPATPSTAASAPDPNMTDSASLAAQGWPAMPANIQPPAQDRSWTPDQWLQLIKELVAATLGVLLVSYTVYAAQKSFNVAGDQTKGAYAKDILTILVGLAGVVLGYYFGRTPADARAAQAGKQAQQATTQAEAVKAKGDEIAAQLDNLVSTSQTRSGDAQFDQQIANLQRARDELRLLSR